MRESEEFAPPSTTQLFSKHYGIVITLEDTLPDDHMSPLDALIIEEESLPFDASCTFGRLMGLEA